MNEMLRLLFSISAVIVFTVAGAFAQNGDSYIQLTRISMIEGNVSYQRVPDEEWAAASVNLPLEPGDRIYTGRGGRAEIEFEEGSVLRLAENTDIEFLALDEDFVQIRMLLGIASITAEGDVVFEFATPAAAFSTERDGIYRFEVDENGRSDAIVRKGRLETVSHSFTRETRNGELISAHPNEAIPTIINYNRRDAWDEWTDRRDADRRAAPAARRYIPDHVSIGVSELDVHGRWVYVSNYGWGWIPYSVTSSWSPYSIGRWVYRPRFGWTWVSYETWGWLPYHYGRWYMDARYGWTWFPGERIAFRFWSPGLVVFYRGSGWISWGALGPGDYYDVSYYRYRRAYYNDLARLRVLVVRQPGNYINRNARGAFHTVSIDGFRGVNVGGPGVNVRRNDISQPWRQGNLIRGGPDISPARESLRPAPDRRSESPRAEINRPVVVRRTPPQNSENDGRFRQIDASRLPPAQERPNVDRGNNDGAGSSANRRPDGNRPGSPNVTEGGSSGSRDRPAQENRRNNQDSSPRDSSGENRDRAPAVSRPAPSQENRQSERPNSGSSSPTRENSRPSGTENPSGSRDRQAAPAERSRPAPAAPENRRNNQGSSLRDSSGENSDRTPAASRPAPSRENRQSEGTSAGGSSIRENSRPSQGGISSGSRDRQAAPAPDVRRNNPGSSIRNSSPGPSTLRAGQREAQPARPSGNGNPAPARSGNRR